MESFLEGYNLLNSNIAHRLLNNKFLPMTNNVLLALLQEECFLHCTKDIFSMCKQKRFSIYGWKLHHVLCQPRRFYFGLNVNPILTIQMKKTSRSSRFMSNLHLIFNTTHTITVATRAFGRLILFKHVFPDIFNRYLRYIVRLDKLFVIIIHIAGGWITITFFFKIKNSCKLRNWKHYLERC